MGNLKSNKTKEEWDEIVEQAKISESRISLIENKGFKVTRLEVINHTANEHPIGRLLTLYKELGDFNNIELSYQDGGRTLKIFLI